MYCKKCGEKLTDDERICHKCGTPVEANNQDITDPVVEQADSEERPEKKGLSKPLIAVIVSVAVVAVVIGVAFVMGSRVANEMQTSRQEETPEIEEPEDGMKEAEGPESADEIGDVDQLSKQQQNMLGPMQSMIYAHLYDFRDVDLKYGWSDYEENWLPIDNLINDWGTVYAADGYNVRADGEHSLLVSEDFLKECASALYDDFDGIFPDIPETSQLSYGVVTEEGPDFLFTINSWGEQNWECRIESWTENPDGSQTVKVGKYNGDISTGTYQFELVPNTYTQDQEDPLFIYAISSMNRTGDGDASYSEYILPESDSRYYSQDELSLLDDFDLYKAALEIYARHGRIFNIHQYFDNTSWYKGTIEPEDFNEDVFNEYEKANLKAILELDGQIGDESITDSDERFQDSWDIIQEYGFYTDDHLYDEGAAYTYSNLSFELYVGSLEETEDYCFSRALFRKPVMVPTNLEVGDQITVCTDEIEGTTEELTCTRIDTELGEAYLAVGDSDWEEFYCDYTGKEGTTEVHFWNGYGRLEAPFYNGVLRIRKDALTGAPIGGQNYDTASRAVLMEDDWNYFDGVAFDADGYVTQLLYLGD